MRDAWSCVPTALSDAPRFLLSAWGRGQDGMRRRTVMDIAGRRFVVTGGASLIGSHLTQQLLDAGAAAVILFDNYALGSPEVAASLAQDQRVTAVRGDITRLPELLDALDQMDGVFALAGFLTLPLSQNPGLGLEVNVLGMYNIVEACRYRGVKKVVFASSVATYGNPEVDEIDETTPFSWQTAPPALVLYAASKIIGENLLRLYQQRYGLDYVALRYATVYGERQHHRGVNALHIIASYERIKAGQPPILPGDGSEGHDYIYVGDVARATVLAMASEVSGESFVIATGVDTSLNDIAHILLRLTGSSLQPVYQDAPGTVAATTKATLGYRPAKAKQLLGWEAQVGVEEGIRRLIAWAEGRSTP